MLKLYHNNVSVCAQKVRIVLAEKDVPFRRRSGTASGVGHGRA
jgi:glutathione S-transferase